MKTIIVSFAIIAMALTATAQGFNALAKVTVEKHIEPVTNGPPAMQTRVVDGQTNQFLEYEVLLIEVTEQVTRLQVGSIAVGTNRISQSQGPRPLPSAQRAAAPTKGPTTPHPGPLPVEGRGEPDLDRGYRMGSEPDDEIKLLWRVAEHTNAASAQVKTIWNSPEPMRHGNASQLRARLSLAYAAALALERTLAGEPRPR